MPNTINSNNNRPKIPRPLKRAVRQKCGFGCIICGLPLYDYDHIIDFSIVKCHELENLILLCVTHHAEKTRGLLTQERVIEAASNPVNLSNSTSASYNLNYDGDHCTTVIGTNQYTWNFAENGPRNIPVLLDDTPMIMFELEDNHLLLTLQVFNNLNQLMLQIDENELTYSTEIWDVDFEGNVLMLRTASRKILISLEFNIPNSIRIIHGSFFRNGLAVEVHPENMIVPGGYVIKNTVWNDFACGVRVGKTPPGIVSGFRASEQRFNSYSDISTEERVIRVSSHG